MNPIANPSTSTTALQTRISSLRQALGATRLLVARRLAFAASTDPVFEVLGEDGHENARAQANDPSILAFIDELLGSARDRIVDLTRHEAAWARALRDDGARRLEGFSLPKDRLPSVFFVARFDQDVEPGPQRREIAAAGMEAMAHALAPPTWAPLAAPRNDPSQLPLSLIGVSTRTTERRRHLLALAATRRVVVEGPDGSGRSELARWLLRRWGDSDPDSACLHAGRVAPHEERAFLEGESFEGRPGQVLLVESPGRERGRRMAAARASAPRWPREVVRIPPLVERLDDLPELIAAVWQRHARPQIAPPSIDTVAMDLLRDHSWPGDVTQLESAVRDWTGRRPAPRRIRAEDVPVLPVEDSTDLAHVQPLAVAVAMFERELLRRALTAAEGNKTAVARQLRLSRQGLYQKLRRHGLAGTASGNAPDLDSDGGRS